MSSTYSKKELIGFLTYIRDKKLVKYQTGTSWITAASKLLSDLSPTEEIDVREVDIELAVHRVANETDNNISPSTLSEYRRRTKRAIEEFIVWKENPASYRPRGFGKSRQDSANNQLSKHRQKSDTLKRSNIVSAPDVLVEDTVSVFSSGLNLSYPLRPDFLAQIIVPRDINQLEAKRLGAFILTLSSDYQPE